MDRNRRKQIDALFDQMLDVEQGCRADALTISCADDDELRREVELLLRKAEEANEVNWQSVINSAIGWVVEEFGALKPEQKIGHYIIKERIGRGGMGEIWRAEDTHFEERRNVAIKVLPPEFADDPARVSRFKREALTVARLNHSNIVTVHDTGHVMGDGGELHFIVTELIEGQTLRKLMDESKLSWRDSVLIAAQVASALNAAHSVNIIHRDIKPENIMVLANKHVKVLDFGIAKLSELRIADFGLRNKEDKNAIAKTLSGNPQSTTHNPQLTVSGALLGTARYMSPEQARGEELDARTDIFSFGLVLYEMIAGRHPYAGKSDEEIIAELKNDEEIPPLSGVKAGIPAAFDHLVTKAIRKNREHRSASVSEMQIDIEHLKSVIRLSSEKREKRQLREQNADQLLTQYVVFHESDPTTRIPLGALPGVLRFAGLKRGKLERALIRKSLSSGLAKNGWLMVLVVLVTMAAAALLSVTETWAEQVMHGGHTAGARCAAFSPDGRRIISGDEDGLVIVWDFVSRQKLGAFKAHAAWVTSIAFSPDGKWFATSGDDHAVIVWDAMRLEKVIDLRDHKWAVVSAVFSPNGQMLAATSGGPLGRTIVWETNSWQKKYELPLAFKVGSLSFFANNRWLLSSSTQGIWNLDTGREISGYLEPDWRGDEMALSRQNNRLVSINKFGTINFIDVVSRRILASRKADYSFGDPITISQDGRLAASGSGDIVLWNVATQTRLARLKHTAPVKNLTFSPNGSWLVSTHEDGAVLLWDVSTNDLVANFNEHSDSVQAVAWDSGGKRFASASVDHSVIIWDAVMTRKEAVLIGHNATVTAVAFSPNGKSLASAGYDGTVMIWDMEQRQTIFSINPINSGHGNSCLKFSPNGSLIATSHGVYDALSGQRMVDFTTNSLTQGPISALSFSADGRLLACVVSDYGEILLWDAVQWRLLSQVNLIHLQLTSVAFSPDGNWLVTGENENGVRLWQVTPTHELALLGEHEGRVKSVVFSPDSKQVVSAGDDKMIALWDVAGRKQIASIGTHAAPVYAVAFSPDGNQLISGGHDHSVRLYTRHRSLWGLPLN